MNLRTLALFLLSPFFAQGQFLGPAEGFPTDPVLSATWHQGTLYLGTQGSGLFLLEGQAIRPASAYSQFERSSIFGFTTQGDSLIPLTQGELQSYPFEVQNPRGTSYIISDGSLEIRFSDQATRHSSEPSGIWRLPSPQGTDSLLFLRSGSTLDVLDATGDRLDRTAFKGLIFDLSPTPYGLLLSTESGYYQWRDHWHKLGSGLPIFAFRGPLARTPLGDVPLGKLLGGTWTIEDVTPPVYSKEEYEELYDVDTSGTQRFEFSSQGIRVLEGDHHLYTLDRRRGLPNMKPGNYDAAILGDTLWIATPSGLYSFSNQGAPNQVERWSPVFTQDGLTMASLEELEVAPHSLGFYATYSLESSAELLGRYRLNNGDWQRWDPTQPILFKYPAAGLYTLDMQVDTWVNFATAPTTTVKYRVLAPLYARVWVWVLAILVLAGLVIWRQRRARIRANERLKLQEQLAEAELASKRGQMNPHFLFNALDAISNFIFKNQPKDAVLYMGKLAKLMRLTLDSTRSHFMVLADEVDLLEQYAALCQLRYGDFEWSIEVDDELDLYDTKLPPMMLQPIVENAVQHAVRPNLNTGKQAAVSLSFEAHEVGLKVVITDNGPGMKSDAAQSSGSHGLSILLERLELLAKKYESRFELTTQSTNGEGSNTGTCVSLILETNALE